MVRNVVIINGTPSASGYQLNAFLIDLVQHLQEQGMPAKVHHLSGKDIKQCIGCFDCWWATPGICRFEDDEAEMLRDMINTDLVIWASPMIMGMYSALLKKFHDRSIPLVHPYLEFVRGECHHRKRYPSYPALGILLEKGDASNEEIENVRFIFSRIAINMHTSVKLFTTIHETTPQNVIEKINHI